MRSTLRAFWWKCEGCPLNRRRFHGRSPAAPAYLIMHSTFLPRIIGVLLAVEGFGYLLNSFSLFMAPAG
jgi:hypothetical protein